MVSHEGVVPGVVSHEGCPMRGGVPGGVSYEGAVPGGVSHEERRPMRGVPAECPVSRVAVW